MRMSTALAAAPCFSKLSISLKCVGIANQEQILIGLPGKKAADVDSSMTTHRPKYRDVHS